MDVVYIVSKFQIFLRSKIFGYSYFSTLYDFWVYDFIEKIIFYDFVGDIIGFIGDF